LLLPGLYFAKVNHRKQGDKAMAKKAAIGTSAHTPVVKHTSQGNGHSKIGTSSMNKKRRASFKKYRGQGR
jgi:hypothetical protein